MRTIILGAIIALALLLPVMWIIGMAVQPLIPGLTPLALTTGCGGGIIFGAAVECAKEWNRENRQ